MMSFFDLKERIHSRIRTIFFVTTALVIFVPLAASQAPPGYYGGANGKTGNALRDALHDVIDDHNEIPFSSSSQYDTQDALEDLDRDPQNSSNVILIYSGYSVQIDIWPDWNREHSWPKSYGSEIGPAEADVFHLFACDANVNSSRGNKYYDMGGTSFHPEAPDCRYDADSWQPRPEERGDIARVMFYLDVRYSGDLTSEPDLELTDNTSLILAGSRFMGKLSTLLEWHEADPVDDKERTRNDFIYNNIQQNRNPFVDNPSYVYSIWGGDLIVDTYTISAAIGGTAGFELDAGSGYAQRSYAMLGSAAGSSPGTSLPGGGILPLNQDFVFAFIKSKLNSPMFQNFQGNLDSSGRALATFDTKGPIPSAVPPGTVLTFAYTTLNPYDFQSNPVEIVIEP